MAHYSHHDRLLGGGVDLDGVERHRHHGQGGAQLLLEPRWQCQMEVEAGGRLVRHLRCTVSYYFIC